MLFLVLQACAQAESHGLITIQCTKFQNPKEAEKAEKKRLAAEKKAAQAAESKRIAAEKKAAKQVNPRLLPHISTL